MKAIESSRKHNPQNKQDHKAKYMRGEPPFEGRFSERVLFTGNFSECWIHILSLKGKEKSLEAVGHGAKLQF